ncbi:MAG: hypothetical protein FJX59_15570 [Alphaproteobacteria bacterium]|nr:hypothetical protein [Alphaproteobacteria bacterium]
MGMAWTMSLRAHTAACLALVAVPAAAQTDLQWLSVRGLLDARFVLTSDEKSWESGVLGKTRFGARTTGNERAIARLAEASLVARAEMTWDLSAHAHLIAGSEQSTSLDVVEAFVAYKPAPGEGFNVSAKAGAFFPPISLENTGLAWTSPYTITPSAINSWVGEELKTLGPEATLSWIDPAIEVSAIGSVYVGNDPAGTQLAWRGWAIHECKAGLFERLPLAQVRIIRSNNPRRVVQAPFDQPIDEIDDRIGYYAGVRLDDDAGNRVEFLRYDNRADDLALNRALQWAWNKRFWSVGGRATLTGDVEVIGQMMWGSTSIITRPGAVSVIKAAYDSGFLLASKA